MEKHEFRKLIYNKILLKIFQIIIQINHIRIHAKNDEFKFLILQKQLKKKK